MTTPAKKFTYITSAQTKESPRCSVDMHPFLSPDGKRGFFSSNESGQLQACLIRGLESLA